VKDLQSLAHVKWECKYHIIWVPKYRREALYGKIRKRLGEIVRELGRQKGIEVIEGQALIDHLHGCLSFLPKDSIPNVTGFLRRKSAIRLHRKFVGQGTTGKHFWVRGYYVSTVGYDEKQVGEYINGRG